MTSDKAEGSGNGKGEKPPEPSEFERFEALTKRVISVPKAEMERREKKYQRRRARRRSRASAHGR